MGTFESDYTNNVESSLGVRPHFFVDILDAIAPADNQRLVRTIPTQNQSLLNGPNDDSSYGNT